MKGISALIGVVLAIGFTILIAALVFTFSRVSVDDKIGGVSESEIEAYCLLNVDLEVLDACHSLDSVEMTIKNNRKRITGNSGVRFSNGCFVPLFGPFLDGLNDFETETISVDVSDCEGEISSGEFIPSVEKIGRAHV